MSNTAGRWKVVVGAVLIQLCLGAIYAWSVFTPGLRDAGWSKVQTQIVFSVGLATFALVMVLRRAQARRRGARSASPSPAASRSAPATLIAGLGGGTNFWTVLVRRRAHRRCRHRPRLRGADRRRHALVPRPQGHDHRRRRGRVRLRRPGLGQAGRLVGRPHRLDRPRRHVHRLRHRCSPSWWSSAASG